MSDAQIYVADLAAYNAGTLYGKWIDAEQSAEEIEEEVQEMLKPAQMLKSGLSMTMRGSRGLSSRSMRALKPLVSWPRCWRNMVPRSPPTLPMRVAIWIMRWSTMKRRSVVNIKMKRISLMRSLRPAMRSLAIWKII